MFQPIPKWGKTGQTPPKWSTPTGCSRCLANAQAKQMSVKTCCWVIIIGIHKVLPLVSCSGSKSMVPCFCCLYPREWWQAPHSCWQYDLQQWIKTYPFSSHPQKRCQYRPKYGVTNEIFWVWRLFMTWSIPIYCHRPSRPSAFSSASPSAARAPSPSRGRLRRRRGRLRRSRRWRPRRWNKGRRWHGRWRKMTWGGGWQWDSLGEDLCHGRWLVSVGSVWHISIWQTNEHILCTCISWYVYIIQLYTVYIYTYTYSSIELERKISWNVKITSSPITTRSSPG